MLPLPDPTSIDRVADWIELSLSTQTERFSRPQLNSAIESFRGTEPSEAFISAVWRELDYRECLYHQPVFAVSERSVARRDEIEISDEYLACLILSLYGVRGTTRDPTKLFERITNRAVKAYLSSSALVFGWPAVDAEEGEDEDSQIKRKIKRVADELGERFVEAPPARFNDRGVDVIGWIPFSEGRSSQIVLLVQCYAGQDPKGKLPVPLASWYQYIHWGFNPISGFAVPAVVSGRDWHEMATDKGLLFDRPRIINALSADTYDAALAAAVTEWVREQLAELQE
jgi:hypothetical protein